jgi:cold shock CspA family protein
MLELAVQTVPEIDFQCMTGTPRIQAAIEKHIAELEQRWGRVTTCRAVLKGPGQHHRTGGLYEVHIRLALPDGREVNVERTPPADERYSNLTFAINDAFKQFGFLESNDGQEVYFHRNSVLGDGFSRLHVGSRVTFAEEMGEKGPQATTIRLLGKHKLRA